MKLKSRIKRLKIRRVTSSPRYWLWNFPSSRILSAADNIIFLTFCKWSEHPNLVPRQCHVLPPFTQSNLLTLLSQLEPLKLIHLRGVLEEVKDSCVLVENGGGLEVEAMSSSKLWGLHAINTSLFPLLKASCRNIFWLSPWLVSLSRDVLSRNLLGRVLSVILHFHCASNNRQSKILLPLDN